MKPGEKFILQDPEKTPVIYAGVGWGDLIGDAETSLFIEDDKESGILYGYAFEPNQFKVKDKAVIDTLRSYANGPINPHYKKYSELIKLLGEIK